MRARIAGDDARTRIVIDFDRKPSFFVHYVANPHRVIVDLPETAFGLKPEDLAGPGPVFAKSVTAPWARAARGSC